MAFLGFGKKRKVLDLTENYKKQIERAEKEDWRRKILLRLQETGLSPSLILLSWRTRLMNQRCKRELALKKGKSLRKGFLK